MNAPGRAQAWLTRPWWQAQPSAISRALQPLAALYGMLARWRRRRTAPRFVPVPVVVVGNLIVGGAGKTPTVIALVQALQQRGYRPGVISRGHGRASTDVRSVDAPADPRQVGDEPVLIRRRTGVPVWVGRDRVAAARALCVAHPEVDVLLSDDGLQHHALPRQVEVLVFDDRGAGNGLLLPAGPLREPLPCEPGPNQRVLYTGSRLSTALPGTLAQRRLTRAWPLADWQRGTTSGAVCLSTLRGRPLLAVAGLGSPQAFFRMLQDEGLEVRPLALPDHYAYRELPWPADTAELVTTEKDAVKLSPAALGSTRVWVLPLDLELPSTLLPWLQTWLAPGTANLSPEPRADLPTSLLATARPPP